MTMSSGSASVVGRSVLFDVSLEATFGAFCGVLRASDQVLGRYLSYMICAPHVRQWWSDCARGTNINNLKREDVLQTEILVPPLAEQQRIVAKLDEIDSDLRTLTEHLDAEYLRSAQVRLSAVDSLFDGITAPEKPLAAVCDVFADGDWIESKDQSNTGIRLVQTGNVGDGVFKDRRDKARWIDENTFSRLNCTEVVPGDILFSRLPDPVGRACMIPDTGERMITAVDCTIARPSVKVVDPEFMVLFASSSRYFAQVRSMITGTTRDRISRKNLGDVPIPVPTLSEQKQIVLKAREIDSLCAEVSENIERRKAKAGELRQSVLAAAFRGEL
jgi:type I restriction enzyme S subunit